MQGKKKSNFNTFNGKTTIRIISQNSVESIIFTQPVVYDKIVKCNKQCSEMSNDDCITLSELFQVIHRKGVTLNHSLVALRFARKCLCAFNFS